MSNKTTATSTPIVSEEEVKEEVTVSKKVEQQVSAPSRRPGGRTVRAEDRPGTRRKIPNQERVKQYLDMIDSAPLDIPDFVRDLFLSKDDGYIVRWVRYLDSKFGEYDAANISKRKRQGWEFVDPAELPEEYESSFKENTTDVRTGAHIVTVGEMVLMKLPLDDAEAFREAQHQKTLRVSQGILDPLNDKRYSRQFYSPNHER